MSSVLLTDACRTTKTFKKEMIQSFEFQYFHTSNKKILKLYPFIWSYIDIEEFNTHYNF